MGAAPTLARLLYRRALTAKTKRMVFLVDTDDFVNKMQHCCVVAPAIGIHVGIEVVCRGHLCNIQQTCLWLHGGQWRNCQNDPGLVFVRLHAFGGDASDPLVIIDGYALESIQ